MTIARLYSKTAKMKTIFYSLLSVASLSLFATVVDAQDSQLRSADARVPTAVAAQFDPHETSAVDHPKVDKTKVDKTKVDGAWPLFRGNTTSTGIATSTLPKKLEVLWKHEIANGAFEGSPIIIGGQQKRAYIGDADGVLLAFDLDTGKVAWEFKSEIGYVTAPAYKDGKLFVGDMDGKFYCIDEQGQRVWEFQADDSIDSSANFYKDLVLFGARDTRLYALKRDTGKEVWRLETEDQVRCGITVVGGRAFVAGCDGALHIIDLDRGQEGGSVLIESPTGVTPAAKGDYVFFGTEQAGFFAVDWKKGETKWTFNDKQGPISTRSSPSVTDEYTIFGARNRKVYAVDTVTGKEKWSIELKANIDSSPVVVGDRIFVGATDGRLYELELKTGKIVWQRQFDGGFVGSPAVAFGRLVIATDRGVVYCLGKSK